MKVKELMEKLKNVDPEKDVKMVAPNWDFGCRKEPSRLSGLSLADANSLDEVDNELSILDEVATDHWKDYWKDFGNETINKTPSQDKFARYNRSATMCKILEIPFKHGIDYGNKYICGDMCILDLYDILMDEEKLRTITSKLKNKAFW